MRISLVTLFPEWFESPLSAALLGRARQAGLVSFRLINPRDRAEDRHRTVDDRPYGGGPGMVMRLEPLVAALRAEEAACGTLGRTILLAPAGRPLTQELARELAGEEALTLICGRYEGIDARLAEIVPLEAVSVGEAVINGGEAAAMMLIEATARLLPGFMGKEASGEEESFSAGLLEYPHYTRPEVFEGRAVPEVLLSGDHARIARWRREVSLRTTLRIRPDLLDQAVLTSSDLTFLRESALDETAGGETAGGGRLRLGRSLFAALVHYPVLLDEEKCGATSLTNLDVHDIARCSRSYGLAAFLVVMPLTDQRRILESLRAYWTEGAGSRSNPDRAEAIRLVEAVSSVEEAVDEVTRRTGQRPFVVGTSAREVRAGKKAAPFLLPQELRAVLRERPALLLFGTGHGLAPDLLASCDGVLRPLRWLDSYNHLSVRSAFAITLDRLLGDCW